MNRYVAILVSTLALSGPAIAQDAGPLRLTLDPVPVVAVQPLARAPLPAAADPLPQWLRLSVGKAIDQYQKACGNQRSDMTIAFMAASPNAPRGWTCGAR